MVAGGYRMAVEETVTHERTTVRGSVASAAMLLACALAITALLALAPGAAADNHPGDPIVVADGGYDEVTVTWAPPADDAYAASDYDAFEIKVSSYVPLTFQHPDQADSRSFLLPADDPRLNDSDECGPAMGEASVFCFTDTHATQFHPYEYSVKALVDEDGSAGDDRSSYELESDCAGNVQNLATCRDVAFSVAETPSSPSFFKADVKDPPGDEIRLVWKSPKDGVALVSHYEIYRGQGQAPDPSGAPYTTVEATPPAESGLNRTKYEFIDDNLATSTSYQYQVRAVFAGGGASVDGRPTDVETATADDAFPPDAPGSAESRFGSTPGTINVTWAKPNAPGSAIAYYEITTTDRHGNERSDRISPDRGSAELARACENAPFTVEFQAIGWDPNDEEFLDGATTAPTWKNGTWVGPEIEADHARPAGCSSPPLDVDAEANPPTANRSFVNVTWNIPDNPSEITVDSYCVKRNGSQPAREGCFREPSFYDCEPLADAKDCSFHDRRPSPFAATFNEYRVIARTDAGTSAQLSPDSESAQGHALPNLSVPPPERDPPSEVSGLETEPSALASAATVELRWDSNDIQEGVTAYEICRNETATDDCDDTWLVETNLTRYLEADRGQNATDKGLAPGTTYEYGVRAVRGQTARENAEAVDAALEGSAVHETGPWNWSDPVTTWDVPGQPQGVSLSLQLNASHIDAGGADSGRNNDSTIAANVSWEPTDDNGGAPSVRYKVYDEQGNEVGEDANCDPKCWVWQDDAGGPNETVSYDVVAVNAVGESPSVTATADTAETPYAPQNTTATLKEDADNRPDRIEIDWDPPQDRADAPPTETYEVCVWNTTKVLNDGCQRVTETTYTFDEPNCKTPYEIQVRAENEMGESIASIAGPTTFDETSFNCDILAPGDLTARPGPMLDQAWLNWTYDGDPTELGVEFRVDEATVMEGEDCPGDVPASDGIVPSWETNLETDGEANGETRFLDGDHQTGCYRVRAESTTTPDSSRWVYLESGQAVDSPVDTQPAAAANLSAEQGEESLTTELRWSPPSPTDAPDPKYYHIVCEGCADRVRNVTVWPRGDEESVSMTDDGDNRIDDETVTYVWRTENGSTSSQQASDQLRDPADWKGPGTANNRTFMVKAVTETGKEGPSSQSADGSPKAGVSTSSALGNQVWIKDLGTTVHLQVNVSTESSDFDCYEVNASWDHLDVGRGFASDGPSCRTTHLYHWHGQHNEGGLDSELLTPCTTKEESIATDDPVWAEVADELWPCGYGHDLVVNTTGQMYAWVELGEGAKLAAGTGDHGGDESEAVNTTESFEDELSPIPPLVNAAGTPTGVSVEDDDRDGIPGGVSLGTEGPTYDPEDGSVDEGENERSEDVAAEDDQCQLLHVNPTAPIASGCGPGEAGVASPYGPRGDDGIPAWVDLRLGDGCAARAPSQEDPWMFECDDSERVGGPFDVDPCPETDNTQGQQQCGEGQQLGPFYTGAEAYPSVTDAESVNMTCSSVTVYPGGHVSEPGEGDCGPLPGQQPLPDGCEVTDREGPSVQPSGCSSVSTAGAVEVDVTTPGQGDRMEQAITLFSPELGQAPGTYQTNPADMRNSETRTYSFDELDGVAANGTWTLFLKGRGPIGAAGVGWMGGLDEIQVTLRVPVDGSETCSVTSPSFANGEVLVLVFDVDTSGDSCQATHAGHTVARYDYDPGEPTSFGIPTVENETPDPTALRFFVRDPGA